jgi:hypothetical protein
VAISFGPGEGTLRRVHALYNQHHASALVWLSGPFFAWARRAGGVHLIDHGDTARGRVHEAHVHGRQPDGVELTQAVAAAELVHWGRLHGATVRAAARPGVVEAVRQGARLGRRAAWTSTLGDALAAVLTDLLRRESLQITVASGPLPLRAFEEVRELVLMEWAHRLAGGQPLSLPAAQIGGLLADPDLDLGLVWRDGDRVPLRVVRSLRSESLATDSARALGWGLVGSRQAGAAPA